MPRSTDPPTIDRERCDGCGICVRACPAYVLADVGGAATVKNGDWCIGCGHCAALCPTGAARSSAVADPTGAPDQLPGPGVDAVERLLGARRSVRIYRDEPVPRELLDRIAAAGRYAPTGTNSRNVRYLVLSSPRAIGELRAKVMAFYEKLFRRVKSPVGSLLIRAIAGRKTFETLRGYLPIVEHAKRLFDRGGDPLLHGAPAVILVHAERSDTCSPFNGAAALYSSSLVAQAAGVGSCFNGFIQGAVDNDRAIRGMLGIPRDHRCYGAMTLGFPAVRYRRDIERGAPETRWLEPTS